MAARSSAGYLLLRHILPRDCDAWDYGTTLVAGDDMGERRKVLARLAKVIVVVEGGPGIEHEATVALAHGAVLIPVGRSGGHAGSLFPSLERPPFVDELAWKSLGDPSAATGEVATAVADIVRAIARRGV